MCEDLKNLVNEGGYGEFHFERLKFDVGKKWDILSPCLIKVSSINRMNSEK